MFFYSIQTTIKHIKTDDHTLFKFNKESIPFENENESTRVLLEKLFQLETSIIGKRLGSKKNPKNLKFDPNLLPIMAVLEFY